MKKAVKVSLIVAGAFILIGGAVFAAGMTMLNWDFKRLSNVKYETNSFSVTESFDNLSVKAYNDDVVFKLSDDNSCRVVCYEQQKIRHSVGVSNNTLEISVNDMRAWYEYITLFSFDSPKTTIYLPKTAYRSLTVNFGTGEVVIPKDFAFDSIELSGATGNVNCCASSSGATKIDLSTGNIRIDGASSGELRLKTSTGAVNLNSVAVKGDLNAESSTGNMVFRDVTCGRLSSDASTGNIRLEGTVASQSFFIERSTGNVTFDGSDAVEITVKTSTGNVRGSLLSDKVFITDSSTGRIDVPKTASGGKCEITTSTGCIEISIKEK